MKSAFDLAMERLGGPVKKLTEQQKGEIAEIDNKLKAKLAEAEIAKDKRLSEAIGDSVQSEQVLNDYAVEVASVNSKFEREKDKVRGK
jgi:hypothetical protein